jgi:putative membrane protein
MKDRMERFIAHTERQRIEACVREAEGRTRGEIVVMVAPASHHYPVADLLGATAFSLPTALAITPVLGTLLNAGSSHLWVFLGILIPLFLVCREVVRRLPVLKRRFIRPSDMEEEVREAAHIQFFRKGLYRTREENGVLIYISVFERRVWILGDRGINDRIPAGHWESAVDTIVRAIKDGQPAEGICRAVAEVGALLEEAFPIQGHDRNELRDLMVEPGSPSNP